MTLSEILDTDIFKEGISEPLMTSAKQEWYEDIEAFNAQEEPATPDISNIWVATLAGTLLYLLMLCESNTFCLFVCYGFRHKLLNLIANFN